MFSLVEIYTQEGSNKYPYRPLGIAKQTDQSYLFASL